MKTFYYLSLLSTLDGANMNALDDYHFDEKMHSEAMESYAKKRESNIYSTQPDKINLSDQQFWPIRIRVGVNPSTHPNIILSERLQMVVHDLQRNRIAIAYHLEETYDEPVPIPLEDLPKEEESSPALNAYYETHVNNNLYLQVKPWLRNGEYKVHSLVNDLSTSSKVISISGIKEPSVLKSSPSALPSDINMNPIVTQSVTEAQPGIHLSMPSIINKQEPYLLKNYIKGRFSSIIKFNSHWLWSVGFLLFHSFSVNILKLSSGGFSAFAIFGTLLLIESISLVKSIN